MKIKSFMTLRDMCICILVKFFNTSKCYYNKYFVKLIFNFLSISVDINEADN